MSRLFFVVLLLCLLNVVVFFWPSKVNVAPHVYAPRAETNAHFVRLNKEIEERFYSQLQGDGGLSSISDEARPKLSEASVESSVELALKSSAEICYRLGPFMHEANFELAQAVLFNANVEFKKSQRTSQESDVLRLFLGPYANSAEVADARIDLKRQRILDHFSRKLDNGNYIISLGIYSSQATADMALRLFEGKLDGVKMQNETVLLPNSYWLHFVSEPESTKLEQLQSIDWGETSVKLGPHTCQS